MSITDDLMMDVILNAVGFLAAGGLSVLIYSTMLNRKKKTEMALAGVSEGDAEEAAQARLENIPTESIEFVRFDDRTDSNSSHKPAHATDVNLSDRHARNRREVIRLAREMLESGREVEDVRKELPVSGAEMEMLKRQNTATAARRTANA